MKYVVSSNVDSTPITNLHAVAGKVMHRRAPRDEQQLFHI